MIGEKMWNIEKLSRFDILLPIYKTGFTQIISGFKADQAMWWVD